MWNDRISPYSEPARAVEIVMRVARAYRHEIRADSMASIETVGLLGESYMNITRGIRPGSDSRWGRAENLRGSGYQTGGSKRQ